MQERDKNQGGKEKDERGERDEESRRQSAAAGSKRETTPSRCSPTCQVLRAGEEAGVRTYRVMIMANKECARGCSVILLSLTALPDDGRATRGGMRDALAAIIKFCTLDSHSFPN